MKNLQLNLYQALQFLLELNCSVTNGAMCSKTISDLGNSTHFNLQILQTLPNWSVPFTSSDICFAYEIEPFWEAVSVKICVLDCYYTNLLPYSVTSTIIVDTPNQIILDEVDA